MNPPDDPNCHPDTTMIGTTAMHAAAFSLVSIENPSEVVAFGLEILQNDGENEATITYRRDVDGRDLIGQHTSAEAARALYNRLTPVNLTWERDPGDTDE